MLTTSVGELAAQMTGRDIGILCNFTLRLRHDRDIAQPYLYRGRKITASHLSASKIFSKSG